MRAVPLVAAVLLAGLLRSPVSTPGSQLEVRRDGRWISWWHAAAAPVQWRGGMLEELRAQGRGVDLDHRDGRFTLCTLRDGRMLLMLTRTTYPGVLAAIPFGLTVPEQAALAGALGCDAAVSLDGGISAQLTIRGTSGPQEWKGLRRVPLGIVASPRPP